MQGEERKLPGNEEAKPIALKSKREKDRLVKKVSEAKSVLEAASKELAKEVNSLDSKASDYGRFQLTGGLKDFVVNDQILELILSEDRKGAVAKAKQEADSKVVSAKAAKAKITVTKQQITAIEGVIKGKTGEDRVLLEGKLKEIKGNLEEFELAANNLEAYEARAQLFAQLSAKLEDKNARENWEKIEKDKDLLKAKLKTIKTLKAEEASAKIKYDTLHSVDLITALLDELIGPFKDAVKNPYEFSILKIVGENLQGKNLKTLTSFSKARIGFGIASDVVKDANIEIAGMGGAVITNLGEVVNLAADLPNLISNELKARGQSADNPNNLLQSNFVSSILSSPVIFELLLNHSANLGRIIWNFQNDIVAAIKIVIDTPSDLTNASKLKLVESLISSPQQIETLVKIVESNVPIFQEMFSDSKGAFNKFMREYGFENPELVAVLIPALVGIGSILPSHHGSIQEILKEVGPLVTSDQPIDLAAIFAPSFRNPDESKFSVLLEQANNLLFGSEGKPGIVTGLHDMLVKNADTIAKLAASSNIVRGSGISESLAKSVVDLAAELINPDNHVVLKETIEALKTASIVDGTISVDVAKFTALGLRLAANRNLLMKLNKVFQSLSNDINNILDKLPAIETILSSFGITRNMISEALRIGIALTAGDSPKKITEVIDLYTKGLIAPGRTNTNYFALNNIASVVTDPELTGALKPLLGNPEYFKSLLDANAESISALGEGLQPLVVSLGSDENIKTITHLLSGVVDKVTALFDSPSLITFASNPSIAELLGVLPEVFEKAVDKGLLDDINKLLVDNSENISKALFAVPALKALFDSYNITAEVIEPGIKLAANIVNGENLPHFKALIAVASKIQFDKDGAPILGITDILALANAGAPLLKNEEFRREFGAMFDKENTDPIKLVIGNLLGSVYGEKLPAGLANLVSDSNFVLVGNIAKSVLDKVPAVVSVIGDNATVAELLGVLPEIFEKAVDKELLDDVNKLLIDNGENISKALFAVPGLKAFFDSYNITAEVIEPRIKLAASLINGENLPHFKALIAVASKIQFDKDGAPILEITDILSLANAGAPLLKNKEFRREFGAMFDKENTDPIKLVIGNLLGNVYGEKLPSGLTDLMSDSNFVLVGDIAKHVLDKTPDVVDVINTCNSQLTKIATLTSVQTQLDNPALGLDERRALHKQARLSQLDASDVKALMLMGLSILETSGVSTLITSRRIQLTEFGNNEFLQSLVKPLLPEQLRSSNVLLPQAINFFLSAAALITDEKSITKLNKVPEKVEIILRQLGEEKPSIAQLYEAASDIGEALSRVINDKDLIALYRDQFIPMIKGSRREIKAVIEDALKASPNARKFHIDSEAVMRFLEDEKSLAKFGSAFNDLLQKDFSSRVRGTLKAAGVAITSSDARTIIWQLVIDAVISYFRENIVPGFVKRWMSGNSIAAVIDNARVAEVDGKPDLADACKTYYTELGNTSLARYLVKTQNFSAQYITSELSNMVIDSFDFKGASFASPVIDLSNTEISNSNLSVALRFEQRLELTGAIIDIKTLESMVTLFNKGQVNYPTTLKLSEAPISAEAQRVIGLITNPEIRAHLETNYITKEQQPTKFADRTTKEREVAQSVSRNT